MGFCGTNTLGGRVGGLMGRWGEGDRDNSGTGTGLCSEYGVEQNEFESCIGSAAVGVLLDWLQLVWLSPGWLQYNMHDCGDL